MSVYLHMFNNQKFSTMKVIKKSIRQATNSKRGQGFNASWKFTCDINNTFFETQFGASEIIACHIDDETGSPVFNEIGYSENKTQFVDEIYFYLNNR